MATPVVRHRRTESLARSAASRYRGEQVRLLNRDEHTGYGLGLTISRPDGRDPGRQDVYLGAGTTTRLYDVCEPGPVTVTVDHSGRSVAEVGVRFDESRAGTVKIVCRNGHVTADAGVQ